MTEAGTEEFAEYGAAALDSFQALFEQTEQLDHRNNDDHARELLGDLLIDLMHYAEDRDLEFNDVLAQAHGYYLSEQNDPNVFPIGSTVELDGPAADEAILLGQPIRGSITGLLVPENGPTEYYVHFLGETSNRRIVAADLEPAPPFPGTSAAGSVINDPLRAEATLIETMTRIGRADVLGTKPREDDLNDHRALLNAIVTWNGMEERNVTDLLLANVETRLPAGTQPRPGQPYAEDSPTPGQLAEQAFPVPLTHSLPGQSPDAPDASTTRPSPALRTRPGHCR